MNDFTSLIGAYVAGFGTMMVITFACCTIAEINRRRARIRKRERLIRERRRQKQYLHPNCSGILQPFSGYELETISSAFFQLDYARDDTTIDAAIMTINQNEDKLLDRLLDEIPSRRQQKEARTTDMEHRASL